MRTWNFLRSLRSNQSVPWMVIGDFNEIFYHFEEVGGQQRNEALMSNFKETIDDCNLCNLGYLRDPFTLSNKHEGSSYTKERLDQAVANQRWKMVYDDMKVETLVVRYSNHKPLLASCGQLGAGLKKGGRLFIYDAYWDLENTCNSEVDQL